MLDIFIREISQNEANMIKSFAIFYLLLIGNFISTSVFTCFQINYIKERKWLKLLIAFFSLSMTCVKGLSFSPLDSSNSKTKSIKTTTANIFKRFFFILKTLKVKGF